MSFPPVVYVGPSISSADVLELLPTAVIQAPVGRGDLYRDRMLFYSVFVIVDGVFFQNEAISPRECIDVCRDGATVIGASSMGALRAAECWAAGVLGAGVIFRMFRAGRLLSDDEVAVTYDPDNPERVLSLPLVNVRYAASRAVRDGVFDRATGMRVVASASALHYTDRRWAAILSDAGLRTRRRELEEYLKRHNLKRLDAVRALRQTAAMLARNPDLGRTAHRMPMPFVETESQREAQHLALGPRERRHARAQILRWAFGTGLYRTLADENGSSDDGGAPERRLTEPEAALEARVWAALLKSDAILYRWRAHRLGVARSREYSVNPSADDLLLAEKELALGHGLETWRSVESRHRDDAEAWTTLLTIRNEVAALRALQRVEAAR